jgi:hypothetical protein
MRRIAGHLICHAVLICGLAAPAAAQSVTWFQFDPLVVPSTYTQPVLLEARVSGTPTRVTLELTAGGGVVEMTDNGTGGDKRAGDAVFTASIPVSVVVGALRADDVQRVFVGFLNLFNGSTNVFRGNMFAEVHDGNVGTWPIARLAPDVQATSRLVNLVDPSYLTDFNVRRVAQTFYRYFDDGYDFLNIVSIPGRFSNRNHSIVRNDVDGIGAGRSDLSAQFGSSGRLRGYTVFPLGNFYDGAGKGYSHETGHQWISQLSGVFASGIPHWPPSSMATGTMGFSIGGPGGEGGDFRCRFVEEGGSVRLNPMPASEETVFNDFDLYLMGLIDRAAAQPQIILSGVTAPPPCNGQIYTGTITRVTADAIVAGAGTRVPDWTAAPRSFRAATILVSRDGLVSAETMWLYSWLTERAELRTSTPTHEGFSKTTGNPFSVMTGGRATIETLLSSEPDFSLVPAQAAVTVTRGAPATFRISVMPSRASFDQPVTFGCTTVPSPLACTFAPAHLTPGAAGADVTLTITTGPAVTTPSLALQIWSVTALLIVAAVRRRRGGLAWASAAAITACLAVSCGGGSPPPTTPPPGTPTPPGSGSTIYNITVTGAAGSLTHGTVLTLTVQ